MYYFISDTHLGHEKIIKYCERPFKSLKEMDDTIIKKWNSIIKEEDNIFLIGDFCFTKSSEASNSPKHAYKYYREKLNGNIIFLRGNHDSNNLTPSLIETCTISHGGHKIFLTHNPKYANPKYDISLCGHVHGKYGKYFYNQQGALVVDCSVENWDYTPKTINELLSELTKWKRSYENQKTNR